MACEVISLARYPCPLLRVVLLRASLSRIFRCTGSARDLRRHRTASLRRRWSSAYRSILDVQTSVPRDLFPFQLPDLRAPTCAETREVHHSTRQSVETAERETL